MQKSDEGFLDLLLQDLNNHRSISRYKQFVWILPGQDLCLYRLDLWAGEMSIVELDNVSIKIKITVE